MTQPDRPLWPSSGAFPFMPFPVPGWPAPPAPAPAAPIAGFDLLKNLWSHLPGSTQVPGFLVPTVDLDEIDKRIADLRAAESWIEVNLNMLRATIQGLDVQRHTIAALQSLSTMSTMPTSVAPKSVREAPPPAPPAEAPAPAPTVAASTEPEPSASNGETASAAPLAGMAASNWLDYLQDQFTKVAQAAMAVAPTAPRAASQPSKPVATKRPAAKRKSASKRRRSATPPT